MKAIKDIREMRNLCQSTYNEDPDNEDNLVKLKATSKCLKNMYDHPEYLSQANIVFSLAGDMMANKDKRIIANSLIQILDNPKINKDEVYKVPEKKVQIWNFGLRMLRPLT